MSFIVYPFNYLVLLYKRSVNESEGRWKNGVGANPVSTPEETEKSLL